MFRRKRKLNFQKTVSKLPIIIFSISVVIGSFFLFRIISTLVKENGSTVEFVPVETTAVMSPRVEEVVPPKEVAKKPTESSKSSVKKTNEKPAVTTQKEQVKTPVASVFYTIQVATFNDRKKAESLTGQLKEKKFSPLYIKTNGKLIEVCVGKFESSKAGATSLSKLKKDFQDAFIRKLQSPFEEK